MQVIAMQKIFPLFVDYCMLYIVYIHVGFPRGAVVKNLPANDNMQKTWVQSLGQEDSLE